MKKSIVILFVFIVISVLGQEVKFYSPNYKIIKISISKEDSKLFYSDLMERYLAIDKTLTVEEKRHLYFGFVFNENYKPYEKLENTNKIKKAIKTSQHDEVIRLTALELNKNPFSLIILSQQMNSYRIKGNDLKFKENQFKMQVGLGAIFSSGNGKTGKHAFHVLNTLDEFVIISLLGYKYNGKQELVNNLDYLKIEKNNDNLKGLYFAMAKMNLDK